MTTELIIIFYFLLYFVAGAILFTLGVLIRSHFWTMAHFLSPDVERVKTAFEETIVARLGSLIIMMGVLVCLYAFSVFIN